MSVICFSPAGCFEVVQSSLPDVNHVDNMAVDSRCECELDKVFDSVNSSLLVVSYQNIWSCDILCIRLKSDVLVRSQKNKSVWLNIKNPGNAVVLFPPIWGENLESSESKDLC